MKPNLKGYIASAAERAGSDVQLGQQLGLTDGSRVSLWKRGKRGRPNELTCARLAAFMGDDPLMVLRLAGHTEIADLLTGHIGGDSIRSLRQLLTAVNAEIDALTKRPAGSQKKKGR